MKEQRFKIVFSLLFFVSYTFKWNVICHSAHRRKICVWVNAVPYGFPSLECSWWSPAQKSVESWLCKHFFSGWDAHHSFRSLSWRLEVRLCACPTGCCGWDFRWTQCDSHGFLALGTCSVPLLLEESWWCVWSAWCFCGPQEFLLACSSNGAALLCSVPCPLV